VAPEPPWKRAKAIQRARRSEEPAARSDGGVRQPASGALRGRPGDVRTEDWLIEDKFTDAKSYTLKLDMLMKTVREALQLHGRLPMWRITIAGERFRLLREQDYLWLKARADESDSN